MSKSAAYFCYFITWVVSISVYFKKLHELPWLAIILIATVPEIVLYLLYKLIEGIPGWLPAWTAGFGFTFIVAILNEAVVRIFKEEELECKLKVSVEV